MSCKRWQEIKLKRKMIIKLFSLPETFHERNVGTLFLSDYEHFEVLEHAKCKLFELHENHFKRKAWNYI